MRRYVGFASLIKAARFGLTPLLLPALPAIAASLDVPDRQVKYLIAFFIVGLIIEKAFLTLVGDRIKLKHALIIMFSFALVGSLLGMAPSIVALLISGILLGIGFGTGATLVPVLIHEGNPDDAPKTIALVNIIARCAPLATLLISGYIVDYIGWRYDYVFLLILTLIILVKTFFEKFPQQKTIGSEKEILANIKILLTNRKYLALTLIYSTFVSSKYVFSIVIPFLLIRHYHYPAHIYALTMLPSYAAAILASAVCMKLCKLVSRRVFFGIAYFVFFLCIALLFIGYYYSLPILVITATCTGLYYFSQTMIYTYTNGLTVDLFPKKLASAISLLGFINCCLSLIVALIASNISSNSTYSIALFLAVLFGIALVALFWMNPSNQKTA